MTALVSHVEEALDRQRNEVKVDPTALAAVQEFHDTVKRRRDTLRSLQEEIGGTVGNPTKDAGSALLGKAAGLIDLIRTKGIAKSLRNDYAAFSLAAIGCSMLHTTAIALGDKRVASLAERRHQDHADNIMRFNEIMPEVVFRELQKAGHRADASAASATHKAAIRSRGPR